MCGSRAHIFVVNGRTTKGFEIIRSIKQCELLSMLYFTVANHDRHEYVSKYNDIDVGRLTLARDTLLLSNTVNGLQRMISLADDYGRKWRISFSIPKTKCVIFWETKQTNKRNKTLRTWYITNACIEEVIEYVHVGVKLNASNIQKLEHMT